MKGRFIIHKDDSIKQALEQLNGLAINGPVLFVGDNQDKIEGSISDGDIRRGLLDGKDLDSPVSVIAKKDFKFILHNCKDRNTKFKELKAKGINIVPVLNEQHQLMDVVVLSSKRAFIPAEGIIMAGGLGSRLKPLTDNTPKPLLQVGGKPIIQYNFERLHQFGVNKINVTLRYLGQQLIDYFGDGSEIGCQLDYVTENEPLGTIGAVKLIEHIDQDYIILMNSDILTNIDYEDFFEEFINRDADMAVATIPYDVAIPYAVLELNEDRLVSSFKEKPTYTYFSNAGIYLIKKELLSLIQEGQKYDATDFMNAVIDGGHRLISYPIRGYWLDIGKHNDFEKAQKDIDHIQF